jgi:hypothetical protein
MPHVIFFFHFSFHDTHQIPIGYHKKMKKKAFIFCPGMLCQLMSSEKGIPQISTPRLCLKGHLFREHCTPWQLVTLLHIMKSIVRSGLANCLQSS